MGLQFGENYSEIEIENFGVSNNYLLSVQKGVAKVVGICDRRRVINRHNNEDHLDENINFVVMDQPGIIQNSRRRYTKRKSFKTKDVHEHTKFEVRNVFDDMCVKKEYIILETLLEEIKRKELP